MDKIATLCLPEIEWWQKIFSIRPENIYSEIGPSILNQASQIWNLCVLKPDVYIMDELIASHSTSEM